MHTFDHWKTTEPESGYDPPEPSIEEEFDRAVGQYEARLKMLYQTATEYKRDLSCAQRVVRDRETERDKYEAALRKIAGWKGYRPGEFTALSRYEIGANEMLETLRQMAEEALA